MTGRRVKLLHREIHLDGVAAAVEYIGEAHDVAGAASGALWSLARGRNRWLACTLYNAAAAQPDFDRARKPARLSHPANAWKHTTIEQQRQCRIVQLERLGKRGLIYGYPSVRLQRGDAQTVSAYVVVVLAGTAGDEHRGGQRRDNE